MEIKIKVGVAEYKQLRGMAKEASTEVKVIASGIVKAYLNGDLLTGKERLCQGKRIRDQFGVVYRSIDVASEALGLHRRLVKMVLEGKRGQTGGYRFEYC
jgi:hypothetical protein